MYTCATAPIISFSETHNYILLSLASAKNLKAESRSQVPKRLPKLVVICKNVVQNLLYGQYFS